MTSAVWLMWVFDAQYILDLGRLKTCIQQPTNCSNLLYFICSNFPVSHCKAKKLICSIKSAFTSLQKKYILKIFKRILDFLWFSYGAFPTRESHSKLFIVLTWKSSVEAFITVLTVHLASWYNNFWLFQSKKKLRALPRFFLYYCCKHFVTIKCHMTSTFFRIIWIAVLLFIWRKT